MQNCNLWCLPENYNFKYYLYHYASWSPQLFVAEENNQICGYVLSKMDDENDDKPEVRLIITVATRSYHLLVYTSQSQTSWIGLQTYELLA
jgi:hypothetical protein